MTQPLISLIHTTARPFVCEDTIRQLYRNTDHPETIEHILTWEKKYFAYVPESVFPRHVIMPTEGTPSDGYNRAAEMSTGKVLTFFSDDEFPYPHWDTDWLRELGDLDREAALLVDVVYNDGSGEKIAHDGLSQFPTCTRSLYEYLKSVCGGFVNPCYYARFTDQEYTTLVNKRLNPGGGFGFIDARKRLKIYHREERDKDCVMEATRRKMLDEHWRDEAVYMRRAREGFPPGEPHWKPA